MEKKTPFCFDAADRVHLAVKEISPQGTFKGYAAIFNKVDLEGELTEPGAYARSIKQRGGKVPILWQHKVDTPIGMADIEEDTKGLVVSGELALGVKGADDAYALAKKGIVTGLSTGFLPVKDWWNPSTYVRHLKELNLFEISMVTIAAMPSAKIRSVKQLEAETTSFLSRVHAGEEIDLTELFKCAAHVFSGNIPLEDVPQAKNFLGACYRKVGRTPPWECRSLTELFTHARELAAFHPDGDGLCAKNVSVNPMLDGDVEPFMWTFNDESKPDPNPFGKIVELTEQIRKEI